MNILVTGATGLVGRALCKQLDSNGHRVIAWARNPKQAQHALPSNTQIISTEDSAALHSRLETTDHVINLAGEPILKKRWTHDVRKRLRSSRVDLTNEIVAAIGALSRERRPQSIISASAVGYYGDRRDEHLSESSNAGTGFLSELCSAWEASTQQANTFGLRTLCVRIGVVLAKNGGALQSMLPAFKLGVGGTLSSGRQYFPWIHIDDLVHILERACTDDTWQGVVNATTPNPINNKTFTKALGTALNRPTLFPVPSFALRTLFGEAADVLLQSQRVVPQQLNDWGFKHQFPTIDQALSDLLN